MYDKCRRFAVDWNIILKNTDIDSLVPNESWPLQSCDRGWEYNKTDVKSSIVIDVRRSEKIFIFIFHLSKQYFLLLPQVDIFSVLLCEEIIEEKKKVSRRK